MGVFHTTAQPARKCSDVACGASRCIARDDGSALCLLDRGDLSRQIHLERGALATCSLVIPQYRRVHLTRSCVLSLGQSSNSPDELLIIDDGSPAEDLRRTLGAASSLQESTAVIPLRWNQGVTRAWNAGARHARGDVLVFLKTNCPFPYSDRICGPLWPNCHRSGKCCWHREFGKTVAFGSRPA